MNDKEILLLTKKLRKRILFQMLGWMAGYTILVIVLVTLLVWIYNQRTWFFDDPLYQFIHWFDMRRTPFLFLVLSIGYIVIFFRFWKIPFSYLQEVSEAAGRFSSVQEGELIQLSAPLKPVEQQLNQSRMALFASQRAAKEAEQRKNDLVAYLAHDLKTPITSVIGYLTLLRDEPQLSSELRARYTGIALNKAERLEELINEFFDITRFNLSHLTLETERIDLSLMLQQVVSEFLPILNEKELEWQVQIPPGISILCDPDKLERVFDNLIRNAVNYSYRESPIHLVLWQQEDWVYVQIRNHGKTISPDKLERIFEQFYRLDPSRGSSGGGAGLGLAIAREIVELHGGTILAESQQETIVFTVCLPANCQEIV